MCVDSTCTQPHLKLRRREPLARVGVERSLAPQVVGGGEPEGVRHRVCRGVVLQVAFEKSKVLKPISHLIGSRLETGWFQAMGQLDSTCTAPPRGHEDVEAEVDEEPAAL